MSEDDEPGSPIRFVSTAHLVAHTFCQYWAARSTYVLSVLRRPEHIHSDSNGHSAASRST
eukprot:3308714-Rhodomonas_salina.2